MGKHAGIAHLEDGFIASPQILATTNTTTVYTGAGKLRGYYLNVTLSDHVLVIKDGDTAMFDIPGLMPAGLFIPLGDAEFLTSLVLDADDAATAGSVTLVYNPYPEN